MLKCGLLHDSYTYDKKAHSTIPNYADHVYRITMLSFKQQSVHQLTLKNGPLK